MCLVLASPLLRAQASEQNPSEREDAAIERERILRTADRIDVLLDRTKDLEKELSEVRQLLKELEEKNKKLDDELKNQKIAQTKEKEALLQEVATIVTKQTPVSQSASKPRPVEKERGYYHTVAKGETLWAIAKAYRKNGIDISVEEIRTANKLSGNKVLSVGQRLFIPKK